MNETTGYVNKDSKTSLIFIKLFPFILSTFALVGGLTKIFWEIYDVKYSAQLSLIVDGVEEAVAELISGLKIIYESMERDKKNRQLDRRSKFNVNLTEKRQHVIDDLNTIKVVKVIVKTFSGKVFTDTRDNILQTFSYSKLRLTR